MRRLVFPCLENWKIKLRDRGRLFAAQETLHRGCFRISTIGVDSNFFFGVLKPGIFLALCLVTRALARSSKTLQKHNLLIFSKRLQKTMLTGHSRHTLI